MSDLTSMTVEELLEEIDTSARVGYPPTGRKAAKELASRFYSSNRAIADLESQLAEANRLLENRWNTITDNFNKDLFEETEALKAQLTEKDKEIAKLKQERDEAQIACREIVALAELEDFYISPVAGKMLRLAAGALNSEPTDEVKR